jgi:hypothetical protein
MRILVRQRVRINRSTGFSRGVENAPDTSDNKMLYPAFNPSSSQSDFRVIAG